MVRAKAPPEDSSTVQVSNPDRVVFPQTGATKGDVVAYYRMAAHRILPHVSNRLLTLVRHPKGLAAKGFFQKNVPPHYPPSIQRVEVPRRGGVTTLPIISTAEHLAFLANQGVIELHVPISREASFAADRLVIDLDPPEGRADLAQRAAQVVREELLAWGIESLPIATGSKGYHVVGSFDPPLRFDTMYLFAQQLAELVVNRHPELFTLVFRKERRKGLVFFDWLRNNPGATVVAPYSLRARPAATLALPLEWSELTSFAPDGARLSDASSILDRDDPLLRLRPVDPEPIVLRVAEEFRSAGLQLTQFDRFRS